MGEGQQHDSYAGFRSSRAECTLDLLVKQASPAARPSARLQVAGVSAVWSAVQRLSALTCLASRVSVSAAWPHMAVACATGAGTLQLDVGSGSAAVKLSRDASSRGLCVAHGKVTSASLECAVGGPQDSAGDRRLLLASELKYECKAATEGESPVVHDLSVSRPRLAWLAHARQPVAALLRSLAPGRAPSNARVVLRLLSPQLALLEHETGWPVTLSATSAELVLRDVGAYALQLAGLQCHSTSLRHQPLWLPADLAATDAQCLVTPCDVLIDSSSKPEPEGADTTISIANLGVCCSRTFVYLFYFGQLFCCFPPAVLCEPAVGSDQQCGVAASVGCVGASRYRQPWHRHGQHNP